MNNDRTIIFSTTCKTCIFAEMHNGTQVDCLAGKLDIYLNKNKAEKVDNHYVINGICQSCRNNDWLESQKDKTDTASLLKNIREENRVPHDLIVDYCSDLDKLKKLLKSFSDLGNIFDNIYIISETPDFKQIEWVIKDSFPDTKFLVILDLLKDKQKILKQRTAKSKSWFFTYVNTDFEPEYNYTEKLTEFIVDKANEVSVITGENILTTQTLLYNITSESETSFLETIEKLSIEQNYDAIKNWREICE